MGAHPLAGRHLERVDEGQVVEGDVIVVVLDVREGLLVPLHQHVDRSKLERAGALPASSRSPSPEAASRQSHCVSFSCHVSTCMS